MHLGISLDKDFEECFMKLKHSYPEIIEMEGLSNKQLDPMRFFKTFLKSNNVANASIDDNSNVNSKAMPTLLKESNKPLMKLLSFNKIFIEMKELFGVEIAKEYFEKKTLSTIYEHDNFASSFEPYCFAYSVKEIYERGLFFINEMKADRPKHLDTFHSLIIESTAFFTNLQSGAVGLVDVLLYSFKMWVDDIESGRISKENKNKIRDQEFQKLIYALNQPFLKGQQQSAYTNFSIMDRKYFEGLFGGLEFYDGTYAIDYVEDFIDYQKAFLNFVREERNKKSFTFPVLTASLIFKNDEFEDEDMAKFVVRHNMKWGDVNIYVSDNADKLSSCCRAQFSTEDIKKGKKLEGNFNSIGGTDLNIGSSKVVTLNLPRLAYLSNYNFEKTKELIKDNVELIQKFHKAHRDILQKNINRGLLPTYEYGLMNLEKQFATIGVTGMEEYINLLGGIDVNEIGEKTYNEKGLEYAKETLNYINELGEQTVEKYGYTQNVEQIPNHIKIWGFKILSNRLGDLGVSTALRKQGASVKAA